MKKQLFALLAIVAVFVFATAFKHDSAPRLYPELEAYFKTIDAKAYSKSQISALENLRDNLNFSNSDFGDWNCILYCTENTFRSQASEVFLKTLCFAKKHKNVKVYSAGFTSGTINPRLITYLRKIGYRITETKLENQISYEVRFSDDANPIVLYSKQIGHNSLPKQNVTSVIVCDRVAEPNCKALTTESSSPFELPFTNISNTDSDVKVEEIVRSIAVAMQYITEKKAVLK